jgi:hypothetical protein
MQALLRRGVAARQPLQRILRHGGIVESIAGAMTEAFAPDGWISGQYVVRAIRQRFQTKCDKLRPTRIGPTGKPYRPDLFGRTLMRRLVDGLAFLALAAATFSWALADDQANARDVRFINQAMATTEDASLSARAAPIATQVAAQTPAETLRTSASSSRPSAVILASAASNPQAAEEHISDNQVRAAQVSVPMVARDQTPRPLGLPAMASYTGAMAAAPVVVLNEATGAMPTQLPGPGYAAVPARYDHPSLPGYAWPTYAAHPNYAAVTYPKQYSPSAWPYIGPFYPYPQVPLGWRKVTLKWDDGWWNLDFKAK